LCPSYLSGVTPVSVVNSRESLRIFPSNPCTSLSPFDEIIANLDAFFIYKPL
jgi:hypothetical protein